MICKYKKHMQLMFLMALVLLSLTTQLKAEETVRPSVDLVKFHKVFILHWNAFQDSVKKWKETPLGQRGRYPVMRDVYSLFISMETVEDYIALEYYLQKLDFDKSSDLIMYSHLHHWNMSPMQPMTRQTMPVLYEWISEGNCNELGAVIIRDLNSGDKNLEKFKKVLPCVMKENGGWCDLGEKGTFVNYMILVKLLSELRTQETDLKKRIPE